MILIEQDFQNQSMWPAGLEKKIILLWWVIDKKDRISYRHNSYSIGHPNWHTHNMWLETIQLQNTGPCFVTCLSTRSTISIKSTNAKKKNSMHHWSKQKIKWLTNYHQLKWLIQFSSVVFIDKILRLTELSTIPVLGG